MWKRCVYEKRDDRDDTWRVKCIKHESHELARSALTFNKSLLFVSIIVNPFHGALLSVHIHRLALWRLIVDVTQRVRDASSELNLILNRWMNDGRVEWRWGEEFAWDDRHILMLLKAIRTQHTSDLLTIFARQDLLAIGRWRKDLLKIERFFHFGLVLQKRKMIY